MPLNCFIDGRKLLELSFSYLHVSMDSYPKMFRKGCEPTLARQWPLEFHASIRFDLSAELWDFGPKIENVRPKENPEKW